MGMYTELIFGAQLKEDTPKDVINTIKYLLDEIDEMDNLLFPKNRNPFNRSSYYFGVNRPLSKFYFDEIAKTYILTTRSNIKNYNAEIESFLNWIKPYIQYGSGKRDMYAIVTYEEGDPEIHYLN